MACLGPASLAAAPVFQDAQLKVDLISEPKPILPGQPFTVGLRFQPKPGWHIYWKNPGDSGMAPSVKWRLPQGYTAGPLHFPFPEKILAPPLVSYGYETETVLLTEITPPSDLILPRKLPIAVDVEWLVCKEICLPGKASLDLTVPASPKDNVDLQGLFDEIRREMPLRNSSLSVQAGQKDGFLEISVANAPELGSLCFFPAEGDYPDEFQPAQTQKKGNRQVLRVPLKKDAKLPDTLNGILVAEKPWDSSGHRALELLIPMKSKLSSTSTSDLPLIFLFAFLGGLILNVMPCVFPVLSLKALHLVQLSGESRSSARSEGLGRGRPFR
ncbi:MAG: hypothetical protein EBZ83_02615 [Verrucomicrobia bacterium]|nr:hypothetical protein [Verrucomicrobiota bacterium]